MTYTAQIKEFIFGEDRPFPSCHASTLELLPGGEVIAAWFGGTKEQAGDVAIWTARRGKEGGWTPPVKTADQDGLAHWNPVLFRRADGLLFLFYKAGAAIENWETRVMRSADGGRTWTTPVPLVEGDQGGRGPVKNKPVALHDGTIAAPASLEPAWEAFVDLSADGGETWTRSAPVPLDRSGFCGIGTGTGEGESAGADSSEARGEKRGRGIIQPAIWESAPGIVHMLARSTEGAIFRSDSADGGRTWCQAYPTSLPNNNSGIDLAKLDDGTLALAYNPTRPEKGKLKGPRTPLVIRLSRDNGLTWDDELLLDEGEKQYSYPAVIASGRDLYVTYTWKRERIAFQKISLGD